MKKTLTVTVPAYNAEPWLKNNLDSFCIPEIMDDLEVLVIDDGSTDRTAEIGAEYQKRYPGTFRVISKENGGHGSGINTGIREASGRYFKVVDADDWVRKTPFMRLVKFLKTSEADLVSSGFLWAYDDGGDEKAFRTKAEMKEPFPDVVYGKTYSFDEIAGKAYIKIHNFTVRTAILKDHAVRVDENCFYEDTEFIVYPIPFVRTAVFLEGFVYMYRQGLAGQSVSMEKMQRNAAHYDRVIASLLRFYGSRDVQGLSPAGKRYIAGIIARAAAARIRIFLSMPVSGKAKAGLIRFDRMLKETCPDVYAANVNRAVHALRRTGYLLYRPAAMMVRRKYR